METVVDADVDTDVADPVAHLGEPALPWELVVSELPVAVAVLDLQGRPLQLTPCTVALVDPEALRVAVLESVAQRASARLDLDAPAPDRVGRLRSRTGEELTVLVRTVTAGRDRTCLIAHLTPAPALTRDALTGLVMRDLLLDRLCQALARQRRSGGELELVVLDLDGFKAVNDRYGHGVGDEVLATVAHRVLALSRPQDTVCRWGGDELVVLLEDPDVEGGAAVSARIEQALDEPISTSAGVLHVGASVGWVRARLDETPELVLHRADMVMYEHKRSRRDRTSLNGRLAEATDRATRLCGETDAAVREALGSIELLRGHLPRRGQ